MSNKAQYESAIQDKLTSPMKIESFLRRFPHDSFIREKDAALTMNINDEEDNSGFITRLTIRHRTDQLKTVLYLQSQRSESSDDERGIKRFYKTTEYT